MGEVPAQTRMIFFICCNDGPDAVQGNRTACVNLCEKCGLDNYLQPTTIFVVATCVLVLSCAETIDIRERGLARDEGDFVGSYPYGISVLFVLLFDPSDNVAVSHSKRIGNSRGTSKERAGNVFERVEEDIVYQNACSIKRDLGRVSLICMFLGL